MNFIKFQNVSFSYENNVILDNISFEINQGESICLVGSNGAGKSTLLQLMTGLLSNYTGSITVENMPVVKKNYNKIRTLLGFVFQDFDSQLFMPTIKQDIAFGLENLGFDNIDQRVNNIAKMLNITDILNKPAFKLSGGEKKLASLGTSVTRTRPRRPTTPIISGVATTTSKSNHPSFWIFGINSSPPTKSAPAACASSTLVPFQNQYLLGRYLFRVAVQPHHGSAAMRDVHHSPF